MWFLIVFYTVSVALYYQARRKLEPYRNGYNRRYLVNVERIGFSDLVFILIPMVNLVFSIMYFRIYYKEKQLKLDKEVTFAERIFRIKQGGEK